jgi:hypothetical protein
MPLEQAAQPPTFHITVGDPTTIGNITGSHTEYKVRTKVSLGLQWLILDYFQSFQN